MQLQRLLYRSEIAVAGLPDAIDRHVALIVEKAAVANRAAEITGALLLSSGIFVQALEGPPATVEATFERICCDLRHRRVRLLELATARERIFGDWSMTRVQPVLDVSRLLAGMDASKASRLDMSTASAVMKAMRTMLLTDIRQERRSA